MVDFAGCPFGFDTKYNRPFLRILIFVAIIIATLSPDVREPTPLESYLCRSLAFTLVAFGILVIVLTGSVPLTVLTNRYNLIVSRR